MNAGVSTLNLTEMKQDVEVTVDRLSLKPKESKVKTMLFYKILAVLAMNWTMIVLATQTTLIFDARYNLLNFIVTIEPR